MDAQLAKAMAKPRYNLLFVADMQQQKAASRPMLPAGQRQR
jgi:hypothetical protein